MPTFREVLVMSLFVNLLALAVPVFTLQVYDRVVFHGGEATLYGLLVGMGIVLVFDYVLRQTRTRIMQTVALQVDVQVGRKLFGKVMALPLQALESQPSSHWQTLFRDVDVVRNTLSEATAILCADLPFAFLFLGLIFVIAAPIAPILLIILPVFVFVAWRSGAVMADANRAERETTQTRDGLIAEMIAGRSTIKALALDRAMRPLWEKKHADNIENSIIRGGKADAYTNLGATLSLVTTISLTAVGAFFIMRQEMTMGSLIATNMLSGRLLGPLNQLVGQWRSFNGFRQAVERLGQLFTAPSERETSDIKLERPRGEIGIENVTYGYNPEAAPVVDDVNLTIRACSIHAMVGRNGSGKTTLLKLIQGLYPPTEGRVLLDGADISQFTRAQLADWIGYVPQECVLFAGSVRDNVAHRHPDADDENVIKAATAAGVHKFIIDLPDGYGTDIGEAGRRLSGGQRQRIAIARALVGDPPVLLLDEPSASLDRQAEQELRDTIARLGKDRTVIVVTHSPILLAACDNLVALDHGKIALAGPSKEILPRLFGAGRGRPQAQPEAQQAAAAVASGPEIRPRPSQPAGPAEPAPPARATAAAEVPAAPRAAGSGVVKLEAAAEAPPARSGPPGAKP